MMNIQAWREKSLSLYELLVAGLEHGFYDFPFSWE